jgi:integrase
MAGTRHLLLTRGIVEAAKPEAKPYRLHDTKVPGLHLRVQPSGAKSWNLRWKADGNVSLGKFPHVTLEAARVRARAALTEGDLHGAPQRMQKVGVDKNATLSEFIDDPFEPWAIANLKAGKKNVAALRTVFADLQNTRLSDITASNVEAWRNKRAAAGVSAATTNRDIVRLKGLLSRAVDWGVLPAHPLKTVKVAKVGRGVIRFLRPAEARALRTALATRDDAARAARARSNGWRADRDYDPRPPIPAKGFSDHLTPLVLTALNTGLRRGELTALTWDDIDVTGKVLHVRPEHAKSGEGRYIPLNSEVLDVLKRWRKQHAGPRVFPIADAKTAWAGLLTQAKIQNFRFHDLRHDFASRLVMAGVSLYVVKQLLGHASLKTTEAYAHLAPSAMTAAVETLAR